NSRVFHAQEIELHRFRVNLAAVVEQHVLAEPEHPGGEILVGLPALGNTRHNVALVIDIGQAVVHGRRDTVGVLLIVTVWVKATGVVTHAKVQRTISLRMPLRRLAVRYKPTQGRTNQGSASGREERSATQYGGLSMSVHASPPRMCRL